MQATRYYYRPRPATISRQRKIEQETKALRRQHINNIISIVILIGCFIGSGYCN